MTGNQENEPGPHADMSDLSAIERPKEPKELSGAARVFQRPVIHGDETAEDRSASWLELFFDLFFVAAIARIAHHLAGHFSVEELIRFAIVFSAIWWVWMSDTYYSIRFETTGVLQRLYVLALMFPVLAMAIFGTANYSEQMLGFAAAFAVARMINGAMWARAAWYLPRTRPMIKWILLSLVASIGVLSLVLFVPEHLILPVLGASVFVSIAGAGLSVPSQKYLPALPRDKLPERHGLFQIIILGETIVPLAVPPQEFMVMEIWQIAAGVLIAIGFWWTYFDFIARRPPRQNVGSFMIWGYLHLPLAVALTLNGVGVAMIINPEVSGGGQILLTAAAASIFSIAALEIPVQHGGKQPYPFPESPLLKVGIALGLLAAAWIGQVTDAIALILTVGALFMLVLYSVWRFATAEPESLENFEA